MKVQKRSLTLFLLVLAAVVSNAIWHYPLLPDKVASHFDMSGNADGWSSKRSFLIANLAATALVGITILGCALGISKLPISMINLPNREYWLTGERKEASFRSVSDYLLGLGSATLLFLGLVFHQAFQVSLGKTETLRLLIPILVVYFVFCLIWTVALIVKFSRKPDLEE